MAASAVCFGNTSTSTLCFRRTGAPVLSSISSSLRTKMSVSVSELGFLTSQLSGTKISDYNLSHSITAPPFTPPLQPIVARKLLNLSIFSHVFWINHLCTYMLSTTPLMNHSILQSQLNYTFSTSIAYFVYVTQISCFFRNVHQSKISRFYIISRLNQLRIANVGIQSSSRLHFYFLNLNLLQCARNQAKTTLVVQGSETLNKLVSNVYVYQGKDNQVGVSPFVINYVQVKKLTKSICLNIIMYGKAYLFVEFRKPLSDIKSLIFFHLLLVLVPCFVYTRLANKNWNEQASMKLVLVIFTCWIGFKGSF